MKIVYLDFETYWSDSHALGKMGMGEYIKHRDTEIMSVALAVGSEPVKCYFTEKDIKAALDAIDWKDKVMVAHNCGFDGTIALVRFNIRPAAWQCTWWLADRLTDRQKTGGNSLKLIAKHFGLADKLDTLSNTKGRYLHEFSMDEIADMEKYNIRDVELCRGIHRKLIPECDRQMVIQMRKDLENEILGIANGDQVFDLNQQAAFQERNEVKPKPKKGRAKLTVVKCSPQEEAAHNTFMNKIGGGDEAA